ncbi:MAG: glycosyltransferase family 9 protein, partial [Deltaproteobacteria bacterium]|nr:glycosyltransferase family 9 protein [Deltaproteobacteria bacterium]
MIIRPSAIGDIVMASPMLRVLRRHYPDAYIAWVTEPAYIDILRHNASLNDIIVWNKNEWRDLFKKRRFSLLQHRISEFSHQLKKRGFDLAIDAQGLLRSRWLAWMSGAKERVGLESKEPGRFLMTKVISRGVHTHVMGSEYRHMMETLGLEPGDFHPEIILSREDEVSAHEMLEQLKVGNGYAVFAPFTTRPQKHWIPGRWSELAQGIMVDLRLPVVLLGGEADLKSAMSIEEAAKVHIFNLAGLTTLGQSAAIIRCASLLIGVDTGLTHMGAAFDTPTIALFGATCPYLYTSGQKTSVIYNRMVCSPCRRRPVCNG